ncbi:predicted protein [Arabidopsis lyrata subsp. lyrata]|uniref:Predicted protein n=1 Tax=Arabidopsis lyrata subsp. lyrata TaxID=81972 RepID=D7LEI0_ARALL|nr:predicted protein [Arabidopsis lyrata subsp. lyrata]
MSKTSESSDTTPAEVLAAVPDEMLPIFEQILALTDPQLQPLVAEVFRIVPHDILLSIMRTKPDSKVRVTEYIDNSSGDIKHVRFASYIKRRIFPVCLDDVDWAIIMGIVANQLDHALAMFFPEYNEIGENIYRGPVLQRSRLVGLHAVSLVAADEENGERYVVARSSHGDKFGKNGYMKISLDVMLVYVPTPGEKIDILANKYFAKPSPLLRRFSYPRLLSLEEEERRKKMHGAS